MTWNVYLTTLIPEIFQYIDSSHNLLQCALVCKKWENYAIPQLYSKIIIDDLKVSEKCMEVIDSCSRGKYVQHVIVNTFRENSWWHKFFSICPNIKCIENISGNDKAFCEAIDSFSHILTRLEEIRTSSSHFLPLVYFECLLKFKKNLRCLDIHDFCVSIAETYPFLTQLCEFENLHTLNWNSYGLSSIHNFNTLINHCPEISTMSFDMGYSQYLSGYIPADSIVPDKSLRVLKLLRINDYSFLEYVFHKFISLEYLKIEFGMVLEDKRKVKKFLNIFDSLAKFPHFKVDLRMRLICLSSLCEGYLGFLFEHQNYFSLELICDNSFEPCDDYEDRILKLQLSRENTNIRYPIHCFGETEVVWSRISRYIRTLTLENFPHEEIVSDDFDILFKSCPVISTLNIISNNELCLGIPSESYAALKSLTLRAPNVHHDTYVECARRFVNLKSLSVYTEFRSVFSLNMSTTKLDTLYLQLSTKSKNTSISIRTAVGNSYSKGCGKPLIDIFCHSIKSLVLKVNDISLDIVLKE